jgi:hypothetical protein
MRSKMDQRSPDSTNRHASRLKKGVIYAAALVAVGQLVSPAFADTWNYTFNGFDATLGFAGGGSFLTTPNSGFGAGSFDKRAVQNFLEKKAASPGSPVQQPTWAEYWLWVQGGLKYNFAANTAVGFNVGGVYAGTLGDGDGSVQSGTAGTPNSVALEEAYGFFKMPVHLGFVNGSAQLQLGRQRLIIDDGFLVGSGTVNSGDRGAYFITPRLGFKGFGTLRFNTDPVRGDFFVLQNNTDNPLVYGDTTFADDKPRTTVVGFDVEAFSNKSPGADGASKWADRSSYLNLTFLHVLNAQGGMEYSAPSYTFARRDGMNVVSVGTGGHILEKLHIGLQDATLYSQLVIEKNSTPGQKVDAFAYFIEPGYQFNNLPLTPFLYYRYSYFSGQRTPLTSATGGTKTSYDTLFQSSGLRFPYAGYFSKIVGNFVAGNSDIRINSIGLVFSTKVLAQGRQHDLSFGMVGFDYNYVSLAQSGTGSSRLADELDLVTRYQVDPSTSIYASVGAAVPHAGGAQAVRNAVVSFYPGVQTGKTIYVGQLGFGRSF